MSLASIVLDFYDDPSGLMTKLSAPAEVQRAQMQVLSAADRAALSDSDFGLVMITKRGSVLRKFPVNDPGNAWLSAQYFTAHHDKLAMPARLAAACAIKQACQAYGVPASSAVDAYAAQIEPGTPSLNTYVEGSEAGWILRKLATAELLAKEASAAEVNALLEMPDSHFALVVHTGDGEIIRKYAMPDAAYVNKAAAYFDKYAMQLQPEHRHRFAASVKARAEELGVALKQTGLLDKWASPSWNAHVNAHLEQRKSLLPRNDAARRVLDKLAALAGETEPETMAQALATFDHATGLDRYYDRGLSDAFASTMDKAASGWSAEIDGETLTEPDLKKVAASSRLKSYLGEGFARQLGEHPVETFEALPPSEQVLIKQLAMGEA
jgi:hypothetical protein